MPTSTAFDPRTAYRDEWRYIDGVEDGTLFQRNANAQEIANYPVKLLRADISRPDWQRYGIALNFSPLEAGWFLWLVYPGEDSVTPDPPAPQSNDVFKVTVDGVEQSWMIQTVVESRIGSIYVLGCVKGRKNASP